MTTREEKLETLLVACMRLLAKEKHYNAQMPKVLESDLNTIEEIVNSVADNIKIKPEVKVPGDLA